MHTLRNLIPHYLVVGKDRVFVPSEPVKRLVQASHMLGYSEAFSTPLFNGIQQTKFRIRSRPVG